MHCLYRIFITTTSAIIIARSISSEIFFFHFSNFLKKLLFNEIVEKFRKICENVE